MTNFEITYAKGVSLDDWLELTAKNDELIAQVKKLEAERDQFRESLINALAENKKLKEAIQ